MSLNCRIGRVWLSLYSACLLPHGSQTLARDGYALSAPLSVAIVYTAENRLETSNRVNGNKDIANYKIHTWQYRNNLITYCHPNKTKEAI